MTPALLAALVLATPASAKTYYLNYSGADGFVEFLDGLVAAESEWVDGLVPHWEALKGALDEHAGNNSLTATGSAEALKALEAVLKRLDVPRAQVQVSAQHIRLKAPQALLGAPIDPPSPGASHAGEAGAAIEARVAVGDWAKRLEDLGADAVTVLNEPWATVINGHEATVFITSDDAEKPVAHCLQFRPAVMADGSIWLTLSFGRIVRDEPDTVPVDLATGGEEACEACGPGPGDWRLIPELTVTTLVQPGQSVLLRGLKWYVGEDDSMRAPADEFVIVTPSIMQ